MTVVFGNAFLKMSTSHGVGQFEVIPVYSAGMCVLDVHHTVQACSLRATHSLRQQHVGLRMVVS